MSSESSAEAMSERRELIRTIDEILDEHEECLKENWEDLPIDVKNARLERVAETRRGLAKYSGGAI